MSMINEQVKGLRKLAKQWKNNDVAGYNLIFDACDTIEALSAKVREGNADGDLIRCKDCKYWQDNNGGYPNPNCRWNEQETPDADDFCSFGERREL